MAAQAVLSRDAEEFLSYLAVERGRAPASISAYRRDLVAYERFLVERGVPLAAGRRRPHRGLRRPARGDAAAHLDGPRARGRAWPAPLLCRRAGRDAGSDRGRRDAAHPPGHPEGPHGGPGRALVVGRHRRRPAGASRPGDPRDPVRDRDAHLGAGGPAPRRPRHGKGPRRRLREGLQGAPRTHRSARPGGPRGVARPGGQVRHGPGPLGTARRRRGRVHLHEGKADVAPGRLAGGAHRGRRRSSSRTVSRRTCSGTHVPPTCSSTAPTSGSYKSSWGTPPSRRPRSTRRSRPSCCVASTNSAHPRALVARR